MTTYENEDTLRKMIAAADRDTLRKIWKALAGSIAALNGHTAKDTVGFYSSYGTPVEITWAAFEHCRNTFYVNVDTGKREWQMGAFGNREKVKVYNVDTTKSEAVFAAALAAV